MMHAVSSAPSGLSRLLGGLLLSGGLLLWGLCGVSLAQITLDGSLGPRGPLPGPHVRIPAAVGQIRGPNLFHSFGEFNVSTQGSATFTGPDTITNILGRVTGGNVSQIDGTLRSEIAGANLYLLNPSGVMFGPNARLDVSGSFHVSTADYLRLADGARFSARLSDTSTLSVAPPVAFGFLGPPPAAITVQGSTLEVSEGHTLSAIGGDVQIVGGTLRAPSGRIQLASVAAAGEVRPGTAGQAPELQVDSFARLGRLELSQNARLDASGNGGGTILIRGGRLLVDSSSIAADNQGDRDGAGLGVDLRITADAVFTNGTAITADSLGARRARDVQLTAGQVHLEQGAQIGSTTYGPGQGGTVRVTATATLTLSGTSSDGTTPSGIVANAEGRGARAGDAGVVVVEARTVQIAEGAQISSSTRGPGHGGTVTVTMADALNITGRNSGLQTTAAGSGPGGDIAVQASQVQLTEGGVISAESTGTGNAGNLTLAVSDTILLRGHSAITTAASQATGGNTRVTASSLVRLQDSQITATVGGGTGDGGNVTIDPEFIVLKSSQITAIAFAGPGGRVSLTASKALLADPSSTVTASSTLGINPVTNISGTLVPLPQAFARATALLSTRCAERLREGTVSTLVVRGRDRRPAYPDGVLPLSLALVRPEAAKAGGTAESPEDTGVSRVSALQIDDHGQLQLRGWQGQGFVPAVLALDCTK